MAERNRVCSHCGTRADEWEEDRFAYVSDAWQCPGCELLEMERENIPEGYKGVKVFLVKNGPDVETSDGLTPQG